MNYESANGVFPASYLDNPNLSGTAYGITYPDDGWNGWPGFGWGTMILPYVEQSPLYASFNMNLPVLGGGQYHVGEDEGLGVHLPSVSTGSDAFALQRYTGGTSDNPSNPVPFSPAIYFAQSDYVLNAGQNGAWNRSPAYSFDFYIPEPVNVNGTIEYDIINGPFFRNSRTRVAECHRWPVEHGLRRGEQLHSDQQDVGRRCTVELHAARNPPVGIGDTNSGGCLVGVHSGPDVHDHPNIIIHAPGQSLRAHR